MVIELYTDGSNYKGTGGYGWVLLRRNVPPFTGNAPTHHNFVEGDEIIAEGSGGFTTGATNNSMELAGIHHGLTYIKTRGYEEPVVVWTDSSYARHAITNWAIKWKHTGWKTSLGKPVANQKRIEYILMRLRQIRKAGCQIKIRNLKGHLYYWNEYADQLAGDARKQSISDAQGIDHAHNA